MNVADGSSGGIDGATERLISEVKGELSNKAVRYTRRKAPLVASKGVLAGPSGPSRGGSGVGHITDFRMEKEK